MGKIERNNSSAARQFGKLLWYDPNPINNEPINLEDLTISIDLEVTSKSKSVIYVNNVTNTSITSSGGTKRVTKVYFLNGSDYQGENKLTTSYTTIQHLDSEISNNYEVLGIESINIDFNSSYAPMVKIKFIDIRGAAMFSNGGTGDYKFFFELPYPIFSLTIKGYYGKSVRYCLHLLRFNANFNSQTGNFEIDCDFIGFTYAVLADMLMGLVRAAVSTTRGKVIFENIKSEYKNKSDIITLDELVVKLADVKEAVKKIKKDEREEDLAKSSEVKSEIETLRYIVKNFLQSYSSSSGKVYTPDYSNGILIIAQPDEQKLTSLDNNVNDYREDTKNQIVNKIKTNPIWKNDNVNAKNLVYDLDKDDDDKCPNFTKFNRLQNIKVSKIKDGTVKDDLPYYSGARLDRLLKLLQSINYGSTKEISIIDVSSAIKACDDSETAMDKFNDDSVIKATGKLKTEIRDTLGFDPTIRNLFRVLCISTEVFLECILDISKKAEVDSNNKRKVELLKLKKMDNKSLDGPEVSSKIYPWPEYRVKHKASNGYYEEWMGNEAIIVQNVPELSFTEELLAMMLNQKRKDKLIEDALENTESWYPISVVDTQINNGLSSSGSLMTKNPYRIGLMEEISGKKPKSTADSALRVLMYRAFLLLGISNRNSISNSLIETHGKLEAENLYDILKKMPDIGIGIEIKDILNALAEDDIYVKFRDASSTNLLDVEGASDKPFFLVIGDNCYYNQIINNYLNVSSGDAGSNRSYIPINGHFDTYEFHVSRGNLSDMAYIKELRDIKGGLFVGNPNNHTRIRNGKYEGWESKIDVDNDDGIENLEKRLNYIDNDGGIVMKLIPESNFNQTITPPNFGSGVLTNYSPKTPEINLEFAKSVIIIKTKEDLYYNPIKSTTFLANGYISEELIEHYIFEDSNKDSGVVYKYNESFASKIWNTDVFGIKNIEIQNDTHCVNGLASGYDKTKLKYGWDDNDTKFIAEGDIFINDRMTNHYTNYGENKKVIKDTTDYIYVPKIEYRVDSYFKYSLFGSPFYYSQTNTKKAGISNVTVADACKALLFLHCFPFEGVIRRKNTFSQFLFDYNQKDGVQESSSPNTGKPTENNAVLQAIFRAHNGFIVAPKIWTLFIGAMLWRHKYANDNLVPITKNGKTTLEPDDPVKWYFDDGKTKLIPNIRKIPRVDEFFNVVLEEDFLTSGMNFNSSTYLEEGNLIPKHYPLEYKQNAEKGCYARIDETLIGLPTQARSEFINEFLEWVKLDTGFKLLRKNLEIETYKDFNTNKKNWNYLVSEFTWDYKYQNPTTNNGVASKKIFYLQVSDIKKYLGDNVYDNYRCATPLNFNEKIRSKDGLIYETEDESIAITNDDWETYVKPYYLYDMELKANGSAMNAISGLLLEKVYIQNVKPSIWDAPSLNRAPYKKVDSFSKIVVTTDNLKLFLNSFTDHFKSISNDMNKTAAEEEDINQQEMFKSLDDDKIKLNIYRTLSSIYQKWVGGLTTTMFTQCGSYNESDLEIAKHERNNATTPRLIDSFRFLDRSFNDIGDIFYINPQVFHNLIKKNSNASFFDIANKILSDNNFNFIPLPSFVNFNKPSELAEIFEPYPWLQSVTSGPSFVCVYAGQSSSNLELGDKDYYPDDGIFITVDFNGNPVGLPEDLNNLNTMTPYETMLPVFTVNYGQQNQNYFKDIKLDQKEFSETAESLEIIDEMSNNGDKNKPVMVGQNLFNVYQKRSYSCEVEMLGCALIQPMMYFQLNNIPMFRGLYLIIKVSHNIKPNGMTTTFKGVRVKRTKTPLLTASDVLMTLLGDVSNNSSSNSNNSNGSGNVGAATNSGESVSSYYNNLKSEITTNPITKIIEGNKVNTYKITSAAETAISDWSKGTIKEADNVNVLQKYANTTPGFSGQEYADGTHWSATFVSHIMTYADENFPKSTQHLSYIKSAMDGGEGYEAFPLKNSLRIKPEVGDIVCYDRNVDGSHCDIIYKIDGGKAHLIGGNLSDTVLDSINNTNYPKELGIGDGTAGNGGEFFKDMIYDSTEYYIIIKKTGNFYYNKKKLTSSSNGSGDTAKSTQINDTQKEANQLKVKNILKGWGLTKVQAAAIMGNIMQESGFNPKLYSPVDINGYTNYGLIQWNQKYTSPETVGDTVESQMAYVPNTNDYDVWVNDNQGKTDISYSTWVFGCKVEVCHNCCDRTYFEQNAEQSNRTPYAIDFLARFDDGTDPLIW